MAKSKKRPIAVLHIRKLGKIGEFILKAETIVLDIGNNPGFFSAPDPPLATVTGNIADLQAAQAVSQTRVVGSAAARDLKYSIVLADIHGLQHYVQKQADNAPDEETAIAIINASGFNLRHQGVHVKPLLAVKQNKVTGAVTLMAKAAGKRAAYEWQQSTDGKTWVHLPSTLKAKTTVSGLVTDVRTYFRFRAILLTGTGSWSGLVSFVVA